VLVNRGDAPALARGRAEALLASNDPLVREWAMTSDVWRLTGRAAQRNHLKQAAGEDEAVRGRYFLKWHGQPIRRAALRRYFRTLEAHE
jgi:hypothetical protein